MKIRKSDSPFYEPVQSNRYVCVEGKWFFLTREKAMQGPFETKDAAADELTGYLLEAELNAPAPKRQPEASAVSAAYPRGWFETSSSFK